MFLNPLNYVNIKNICGLCLSKNDQLSQIDSKMRTILETLDIKVKEEDDWQICEKCLITFSAAAEAKEKTTNPAVISENISLPCAGTSKSIDLDSQSIERPKRQCTRSKNEPKGNHNLMCKYCKKFLSSEYTLARHMTSLHDWKGYKCSICSSTFTTIIGLTSHVQKSHRSSKQISGKKYFNSHIRTCHSVICKVCRKKFAGKKDLFQHLINVYNNNGSSGVYPTRCDRCGISFSSALIARRHKQTQC